jgi:hypothetical protein
MASTFHDFGHVMSVMDGNRLVAKAKHDHGSWLMVAYGSEWITPVAAVPNKVTRSVNRRYMLVKSKKEARAILTSLL